MSSSKDITALDYRQLIQKALVHPLFILSIFIMLLNDHFLKGAGILPTFLTGKISDFAFLFFAPILLANVLRVKALPGLRLCYLTAFLAFTGLNVSPEFSRFAERFFRLLGFDAVFWPDGTDLFTLSILPLSYHFFLSRNVSRTPSRRPIPGLLIAGFAILTCLNTSRGSSHRPIIVPWEEFRKMAKVEKPRPLRRNGKLLKYGDLLFISEPGKGVHVYNNLTPTNPTPIAFINIPGNVDLEIKDHFLYADSLTDLLVIDVKVTYDIKIVKRLKDVFPYNPRAFAPENSYIRHTPTKADGATIEWKEI